MQIIKKMSYLRTQIRSNEYLIISLIRFLFANKNCYINKNKLNYSKRKNFKTINFFKINNQMRELLKWKIN